MSSHSLNTPMNGFDAYSTYNAFKLHFKGGGSYDYFTFNGKTNLKISSYEKRRDRYQFEKIASRISKEKFLDKMLVEQKKKATFWIGDILTRENDLEYLKWRGFIEAFETYNLKKEVSPLIELAFLNDSKTFKEIWLEGLERKQHPRIFKMILKKEIQPETFICIDQKYGFVSEINSVLEEDPIWNDYYIFLKKYYKFVMRYIPSRLRIMEILK